MQSLSHFGHILSLKLQHNFFSHQRMSGNVAPQINFSHSRGHASSSTLSLPWGKWPRTHRIEHEWSPGESLDKCGMRFSNRHNLCQWKPWQLTIYNTCYTTESCSQNVFPCTHAMQSLLHFAHRLSLKLQHNFLSHQRMSGNVAPQINFSHSRGYASSSTLSLPCGKWPSTHRIEHEWSPGESPDKCGMRFSNRHNLRQWKPWWLTI